MIKFKDYLTELFDRPVPFTKEFKGFYHFFVNNTIYYINIETVDIHTERGNTRYDISFSAELNGTYTYDFEDALKGNGNQVMSTVVAICKDHFSNIKLIKDDQIFCTAETNSKTKLYKTLLIKFLKQENIKFKYIIEDAKEHYREDDNIIFTIL